MGQYTYHPLCDTGCIMWIISQHGFYSIVRDRENASRFLIRSRVARDLANLKSLAGLEASIRQSEEREYPFRLLIDERELPRVMNALGNSIDYPSFTARVAQRIDQACRMLVYGEVFGALRAIYDPTSPARALAPQRAPAHGHEDNSAPASQPAAAVPVRSPRPRNAAASTGLQQPTLALSFEAPAQPLQPHPSRLRRSLLPQSPRSTP